MACFSFELHRELAEAIAKKDAVKVIDATTRHYEDYSSCLSELLLATTTLLSSGT